MSIKINFEWKSEYLGLYGYYLFNITIENSDKTVLIKRRFSQIESLYELLITLNPGCRIPKFPEKSFWLNIAIHKEKEIENRKNEIEKFLNYVYQHHYLSKNPYFINFISDNLNESSNLKNSNKGFVSKITNYFWGNKKQDSKQSYSIIEGNNFLNEERENFLRLSNGVKDIVKTLKEQIEINENKIKSLKKIYQISKRINYNGLEYKESDNFEVQMSFSENINEDIPKEILEIRKNIDLINKVFDEERNYEDSFEKDYLKNILDFQTEVEEITDIFQRREIFCKKNENDIIEEKDINFLKEFDEQLTYEIENFNRYRKGDLLIFLKDFYIKKYKHSEGIKQLFEN